MKAFDTFFYILWTFGIYYGHLVYFMVYMLWSFDVFYGIFCVHLVYFFTFWYVYEEKSGNPVQSSRLFLLCLIFDVLAKSSTNAQHR
jgi:cytochrome c oxidase assembly factor CtaG